MLRRGHTRDLDIGSWRLVRYIMSFKQLINNWPGGVVAFASDIGVPEMTVRQMLHRDSVSPDYWLAIVRAAAKRGVKIPSTDVLAKMYEKRWPKGRLKSPRPKQRAADARTAA